MVQSFSGGRLSDRAAGLSAQVLRLTKNPNTRTYGTLIAFLQW